MVPRRQDKTGHGASIEEARGVDKWGIEDVVHWLKQQNLQVKKYDLLEFLTF